MNISLPSLQNKRLYLSFLVILSIILLSLMSSKVWAQNADTTTSDYALDVASGEKDQDPQTLETQQEVAQDEDASAAADDGNPATEPVVAALDEMVAPEEAVESAQLVDNPQATSSENDNGEILKDQANQSSDEKPNEDVNTQDDNKAPVVDPEKEPPVTTPEQPLENLQTVEPQGKKQQTEQPQGAENSTEESGENQ